MASQEELDRARELNELESQRKGISEENLDNLRSASNVIQDQLKFLKFERSERTEIRSITKDLNKIANDSYNLTLKELGTQKTQDKLNKDRESVTKKINGLLNLRRSLSERGVKINQDLAISIRDQVEEAVALRNELKRVEEESSNIAKNFGVKGFAVAEDIVGAIPGLRQFKGTFTAAADSAREVAASGKSSSAAFAAGAKSLGRAALAALPLLALKSLADAFISVDKSSGELAKNLGISYDESLAIVSSMTDVANLSMDTFITTEGLVKAQQALSSALGTNVQLSSDLLVDFTKLTEQAGYSAEAATTLGKVSLATGKPVKDITTQFLGQAKALNLQNDLALNEKQLLESVAKTSKGTLATFASQPKKLAEAVFQAKKLGLEMSQLESMADGLLDIESSLTAEFEAEVITGKQLNLERARFFALTNDIAGVGREIEKQGYSQQQFAEATRIEQDAMAKAMGLSRDELGNMLITSEALRNTGAKNEEDLRKQYEAVRGTAEEQAFLNKLGSDQYAQQLKSQSVQERFNKTVAKLQDIFVSIAEPVLAIVSPFADLVNTVMPALNLAIIPIKAVFEGISFIVQGIANGVRQLTGFLKENLDVATVLLGTYTTISTIKNRTLIASKLELAVETLKNAKAKAGAAIQTTIDTIKNKGLLKTIAEAAMSAFSSVAKIPFVGPALGAAAAAAAYMLGKSYMSKGDDIMSPGGYGSRTLMGPEGSIALNNKDTVIAGTNLFPKERGGERNTSTSVILSDAQIQKIANAVRDGASRATINLDGDRISSRLQTPMITNTLPGV